MNIRGENRDKILNFPRRDFLAALPLSLAAEALSGCGQSSSADPSSQLTAKAAPSSSTSHSLDFASALEAAEAIRRKKVSSLELTRRVFERIDRYNPQINAFVYQLQEEALAEAKKADEAQAHGRSLGVLHGVPVHVKENFAVAGHPCTWGLPPFRNSKAPKNSDVVDRLVGSGAILVGATNVPVGLADWQTYNPIYGTTNNPWDLKRTPGGSSGGSAAALAAGLGYLSVGTDLAGSIRIPPHFCGIYAHKPTLDLVSSEGGSQPGGGRGDPGFSTLLAVSGPMARSAADLLAALRVLGGPVGWEAKVWKWELPPPRASSLKDFRVGYILDDLIAPPTPGVKTALETVLRKLERAGAKLKAGWPPELRIADLLDNYFFHLWALLFSVSGSPEQREELQRKEFATRRGRKPTGQLSSFSDWQQQNIRRLRFRSQWQAYFQHVDVFLSPVAFTESFPHDHSEPQEKRMITAGNGARPYMDMMNWIASATLTGCPSTAAPIGRTDTGLPIGIQIMGPHWEDATPITFADLLAKEAGGFVAPPGYQ